MTSAAERETRSDELISASETLRGELLSQVEKLEALVAALQAVVDHREVGRDQG